MRCGPHALLTDHLPLRPRRAVERVERLLLPGEKHVEKGNFAPAAITNHLTVDSLAALARCPAANCDKPGDSLTRYVRMAQAAKSCAAHAPAPSKLVERVFAELQTVDQGFPLTTWNEAYVLTRAPSGAVGARLYFKSPQRPNDDLQWIDFSHPDFDCRSPRKVWWIAPDRAGGDRTAEAVDFTPSTQERLAEQHRKSNGGSFPDALVAAFVAYPQTHAKCMSPNIAKTRSP